MSVVYKPHWVLSVGERFVGAWQDIKIASHAQVVLGKTDRHEVLGQTPNMASAGVRVEGIVRRSRVGLESIKTEKGWRNESESLGDDNCKQEYLFVE